MKTVVITGSTRGIGYGLADQFMLQGCQVVVSGRSQQTVDEAAAGLAKRHGDDRVFGFPCEVSDYAQVQALWNAAIGRFQKIDIWINNAGLGNTLAPLWELDPQDMQKIVNTNVLGSMYGCKVAVTGMLKQGYGSVYNLEGYGSRSSKRIVPGLTPYGTTKAALAFLDQSLAKELEGKPVYMGSILPGMVVTDLLLNQRSGSAEDWERTKWAINVLGEKVETIAPWVVEQVLKNDKNGAHISWLSGPKVMLRFLTAPITKRKIIE